MLRNGLATVYEAKFGSEFGGMEKEYREAEEKAKRAKIGIWSEPSFIQRIMGAKAKEMETPRQFKTRMAETETVPKESPKPVASTKTTKKVQGSVTKTRAISGKAQSKK